MRVSDLNATIERFERELTYFARRLDANVRQRRYPLDRAHYILLLKLAEGPLGVSALAEALNLDGSTVTRQIAAMEKRGYVEKHPNPEDGRGALVTATKAGLEAADSMRLARLHRIAKTFGAWREQHLHSFAALLARGTRSLERFASSDAGAPRSIGPPLPVARRRQTSRNRPARFD